MDTSMSVTEIHARNKVMTQCGVDEDEYHIVFTASAKVWIVCLPVLDALVSFKLSYFF